MKYTFITSPTNSFVMPFLKCNLKTLEFNSKDSHLHNGCNETGWRQKAIEGRDWEMHEGSR